MDKISELKEIIKPIIEKKDAEIVDIIYRREGTRQVLRLLVDKEGGIKLSECISINEAVSNALDASDLITERYILEVDSPGIDRPFKAKRDYEKARGRLVRVTLNEAILDKKEYIARLEEILDSSIRIHTLRKGIIEIPFKNITRARQEVEF